MPIISACAAVGNCTEENKALPVTTGAKDHGSDGGFQWRLGRLDGPEGLKPWCAAQGIPWYTIKSQAAFFVWEVKNKYPNLWRDLHEGVKKLETLTANIMVEYEIPNMALAHLDQRITAARNFMARWAPQPDITAPVPAPTGVWQVDPVLIQTLIQIGAPLIEAIIKAVLNAHGVGVTPGMPVTIHPPVASQQTVLPPFNPEELVSKIVEALTKASQGK